MRTLISGTERLFSLHLGKVSYGVNWLAGAVFLVFLVTAIGTGRFLFADGADFFVGLLGGAGDGWPVWDDSKHIRLFVNYINQFFVAVAVRAGFDSIPMLRTLFGLGVFFMPVLLLAYCFMLSRRAADYRVFLASMFSWTTFVLPSLIFPLNQAITTSALCWILLHYIILRFDLRLLDWFVIIAIEFALFRSHEGMILWGGVLFLSSLLSLRADKVWNVSWSNGYLYFIGVFGLLQAGYVVYWQSTHPVEQATESFIGLLSYIAPSEAWIGNTRISLLLVACVAAIILFGSIKQFLGDMRRRVVRSITIGFITLLLLTLIVHSVTPWINHGAIDPVREYLYRFLIPFGSPVFMFLSYFLCQVDVVKFRQEFLGISLSVAVGLTGATLWQIGSTAQWAEFSSFTSQVMKSSKTFIIAPDEVKNVLAKHGKGYLFQYGFGWTWPVLGLSLQPSRFVNSMFSPDGFNEYFRPPSADNPYPLVPFVQLYPGDVFIFDDLLNLQGTGGDK